MLYQAMKREMSLVLFGVACGLIGNFFVTSLYRLIDSDNSWLHMVVVVLCLPFVIGLIWLVHRSEYSNKIEK
ncbi:MAG: hypothetical protein DDT42_02011 [candidate division WS2 bacterium]|uniref:Uncharacterized protein n=1 Tax=Psychracetigena formicireducens TaxID=2986056 RepID=A0A9E2F233_PSYF1|nr:hypothetical protein [Candidatus Psychracetigena formicireducens]